MDKIFSLGLFGRLFLPLTISFAALAIYLFLYIPDVIGKNAQAEAIENAQLTVNQYKTLRGYYAKYVVKPVLSHSDVTAVIDHKDNKRAIPLPATMIHDLSEKFSTDSNLKLKLYSQYPFPNRASRKLDQFQQDAWDFLSRNPDDIYSQAIERDGKRVIRVAIADKMTLSGCVSCHNSHPDTPKNDWKVGDVRGVLEISTPIDAALARGNDIALDIVVALIISLLLILLFTAYLYRKVVRDKLHAISAALQDIADGEGDLTQRLDDRGSNEVSDIAKHFNRFVEKIHLIMVQVSNNTDNITCMVNGIAQDASNASQLLAKQLNATDQAATAVEQMSSSVQDIASRTVHSANFATNVNTHSNHGQEQVSATMQTIISLCEEIKQASDITSRLAEESNEVGAVLEVIQGIAEQTNLLALNAAIEAARAGEQGRGFAVVADEVRTLAIRTQQSTEKIRDIIERVQQGTQETVKTMQEGRVSAEESVLQVKNADIALHKIAEVSSQINDMNCQIAATTEEVRGNINEIVEMSNDSNRGFSLILGNVVSLKENSHKLEELVAQFKI